MAMQPLKTSHIPPLRMAVLFGVMLVTAAGNTAMQSVMPSAGTALGVDDVYISLAFSWSALLWMLTAPFWARRSDQRGRKAMMAQGLTGFAVSFGLCGFFLYLGLAGFLGATATLLFFAASRAIYGGFGSAAPPAVQAYVASRTMPAQRTQAMSVVASSFGLGTVIGPAVAPLLIIRPVGLIGPFIAFVLVALLMLVTLRLLLPNDDPAFAARGRVVSYPNSAGADSRIAEEEIEEEFPDGEGMAYRTDAEPSTPARLRWRDRRIRYWLAVGVLGGHAQAAMLGISGFLVLDRLDLRATPEAGTGPIGIVMMAGATATLLAQWGLIPFLKLGPRASVLYGMACALAGTTLWSVASDLHSIAMGFALASLGFGLFRPGFTAGASLAVSRAEQGQVSGIVASAAGAAYVVAPALGVWLYNTHPAIGFGAIGALVIAVLAMGWRNLALDSELGQPTRGG